jgi:hypothetical protein
MNRFSRRLSELFLGLLLAGGAGLAVADCQVSDGRVIDPQTYPMSSLTYSVQYQIDGGSWTTLMVYISFYGATMGSPFRNVSGYTPGTTSMSFTSIPLHPNALVKLRVTKLFGTPFQASDRVSLSPAVKLSEASFVLIPGRAIATACARRCSGRTPLGTRC